MDAQRDVLQHPDGCQECLALIEEERAPPHVYFSWRNSLALHLVSLPLALQLVCGGVTPYPSAVLYFLPLFYPAGVLNPVVVEPDQFLFPVAQAVRLPIKLKCFRPVERGWD